MLHLDPIELDRGTAIDVDDRFVGDGDGIPTAESRGAIQLVARTEAIFLDPTYTAKGMAGLIAYVRRHDSRRTSTSCSGTLAPGGTLRN